MFGVNGKKLLWQIIILLTVLGLAACSSTGPSSEQGQPSPAPASNSEEASTENNGSASQEGATRVVKDEFGEVTIPVHPKRVMGVYLEDYLTALGETPVMQWYHPSWGKQDYLGLNVQTFDITGSLEVLLDANPDLIIVDGAVDAAKYEQYSKIAPTYRMPENILQRPSDILKTIADLLNVPDKGEQIIAKYTKKMEDTKEKLKHAVGDETVAVVRINIGDKTLALFGLENRYTGTIYKEMGLTPHPFARDMKDFHAVLSEEKIPELDADHIILFPSNGTWTSEENKEASELLEHPLWKSLPAVQAGHVYKAERTHWQSGAIMANMKRLTT